MEVGGAPGRRVRRHWESDQQRGRRARRYRMRLRRFIVFKPLVLALVLPLEFELCRQTCAAMPGAVAPRERRSVHFPMPHGRLEVPVFARDALPAGHELEGPAVIEEYSSTTVLMPGDRARVGALGEIVIRCRP